MLSLTQATLEFQSHFDHVRKLHGGKQHHIDSFIAHKLRHVYGVLDATLRVIAMEPVLSAMSREFSRAAEIAAMWHDIGRFYQVQGDTIVGNGIYEHGDGAYKLLLDKYPDLMPILLAVKIHNKFDHTVLFGEPAYQSMSPADQQTTLLLTQIVRDADKIQNMTYDCFDHFDALARFDKYVLGSDDTYTQPIISPGVLQSLLTGKQPRHADLVTVSDSILSHYSRLLDMNFESSKTIIRQLGFFEHMCDRLRHLGVSESQISQIPALL